MHLVGREIALVVVAFCRAALGERVRLGCAAMPGTVRLGVVGDVVRDLLARYGGGDLPRNPQGRKRRPVKPETVQCAVAELHEPGFDIQLFRLAVDAFDHLGARLQNRLGGRDHDRVHLGERHGDLAHAPVAVCLGLPAPGPVEVLRNLLCIRIRQLEQARIDTAFRRYGSRRHSDAKHKRRGADDATSNYLHVTYLHFSLADTNRKDAHYSTILRAWWYPIQPQPIRLSVGFDLRWSGASPPPRQLRFGRRLNIPKCGIIPSYPAR